MKNKELGLLGEDIACKYLIKKGHKIKERNFNKPLIGELDIVSIKNNVIHFVEVKSLKINVSRVTKEFYKPEYNIGQQKQKRLLKTIYLYLNEKKINLDWQFDVLSIYIDLENKRSKVYLLDYIILSFDI